MDQRARIEKQKGELDVAISDCEQRHRVLSTRHKAIADLAESHTEQKSATNTTLDKAIVFVRRIMHEELTEEHRHDGNLLDDRSDKNQFFHHHFVQNG